MFQDKINWLKQKLNGFKRWIIALIVGTVCLAALVPLTEPLPTLMIDGEAIVFAHTDENTDENLIIRTDQKEYVNFWGSFSAYFSIMNKSGEDQQIRVVFSLQESPQKYVRTIQEYGGEIITLIPTSTIPLLTTATSTVQERIIPAKQVIKTIWTDKTIDKKPIPALSNRKSIKQTKENKGTEFLLKNGETKFFKANIKYSDFKDREEFLIEAFGDQGGYGHLF